MTLKERRKKINYKKEQWKGKSNEQRYKDGKEMEIEEGKRGKNTEWRERVKNKKRMINENSK